VKRRVWLTVILIIIAILLVGCSKGKKVEFKEFYSQAIGFSEKDEMFKPIPENGLLMINNEEYTKFNDKYFTPREIPMASPDKEKAVVFIQMPGDETTAPVFKISKITAVDGKLVVDLKKSGEANLSPSEEFTGIFKWVVLAEIDKTEITENMEIVIKK